MMHSRLLGTGSYVPESVLTNADLGRLAGANEEWILQRTGIRERRVAPAGVATSDMGLIAARRALEAARVQAADLDFIVFCTITPDTHCPSAACWLQGKLGASQAVAFDVNAACSGFLYGLTVGDALLAANGARRVLVVAGETMTRAVDYTDRSSCVLWGDGAGAVVMAPADDGASGRLLSAHLHADGGHAEMLQYPGGGSAVSPINARSVAAGRHWVRMEGPESFRLAVRSFVGACEEALSSNQLTLDDVRWLIPHQANLRLLQAVARELKCPMEKVVVTVDRYGNSSSASIPIALDEAVRQRDTRRGDVLLLAAFGGGLTWGSVVAVW